MDLGQSLGWHGQVEMIQGQHRALGLGSFDDVAAPPARPLVRPAPRSAMVFPLVVLVAVLPGLAALNSWDLTPPGPMWGLRGLAVLDGLVLDQMPAIEGIKSNPGGGSLSRGYLPATPLRLAGSTWILVQCRSKSALERSSQLPGRCIDGHSGLLAWPTLAWCRFGANGGDFGGVQSEPVAADAGGDANDLGSLRSIIYLAGLWLA